MTLILEHHGIKNQTWGVRRGPPYPLNSEQKKSRTSEQRMGDKNLKKAKTANLDKWGKSPDTNVLYIGGYSGSGKSTTADSMADNKTDTIHLDVYYQSEPGMEKEYEKERSKEFDLYLKKNGIKRPNQVDDNKWKEDRTLYKFEDAVADFGKEQYKKGRKVIVEGVQILDGTLHDRKEWYKDKPIILMNTNAVVSISRAFDRDGRGNIVKGLLNLDDAKDYINWYVKTNQHINTMTSITDAKKGEQWVKDYLKQFK